MKTNQMIVGLALLGMTLKGCTCKTLVQAPNPNLDPLPTAKVEATVGADALAEKQWSVSKLGLDKVWAMDQGTGSKRVTVALLSTGVDYNHEDLRANIWINKAEEAAALPGAPTPNDGKDNDGNGYVDDLVGYDVVEDDGLPYDRNGLGTAAAGIMAAAHGNGKGIRGVAANLSLIPVRYIGAEGRAFVPHLVRALSYASAVRADIVFLHLANLSYSRGRVASHEESALKRVMGKLRDANVPVVVSAGNSNSDPAKSSAVAKTIRQFDNALFVTSVDQDDRRPFIANYGLETVHTAAPGEKILTTLPGNKYGEESGTFAAAAHVTGALALAIGQQYGRLTYSQLYNALLNEEASDTLPDMRMESVGGNRLQVAKFLKALNTEVAAQ